MKYIFKILFIFLVFSACKNNSPDKKNEPINISEKLTEMNRMHVEKESKRIEEFIARHSFQTARTGTGLRYQIYVHGKGDKPIDKEEVEINFKVYLLDDKLCYSSDSTGSVKLRLGIGEQVRGLEEGLMLMVPGDKAHLILPSHLAYGMAGDRVKIPPSSALYYDVELLKINK